MSDDSYGVLYISDDYRETACVNILKLVSSHYKNLAVMAAEEKPVEEKPQTPLECSNPECTRSRPGNTSTNVCAHVQPPEDKTPAGKRNFHHLLSCPLLCSSV